MKQVIGYVAGAVIAASLVGGFAYVSQPKQQAPDRVEFVQPAAATPSTTATPVPVKTTAAPVKTTAPAVVAPVVAPVAPVESQAPVAPAPAPVVKKATVVQQPAVQQPAADPAPSPTWDGTGEKRPVQPGQNPPPIPGGPVVPPPPVVKG